VLNEFELTPSSPVVSNGYTSKCSGPYWLDQYGAERFGRLIFATENVCDLKGLIS